MTQVTYSIDSASWLHCSLVANWLKKWFESIEEINKIMECFDNSNGH